MSWYVCMSYGNVSKPFKTYIAIFGKMNIHESQLFLGEQKGTRLLTHTHITIVYYNVANPIQNLPFKDDIYNPCIALLGLPWFTTLLNIRLMYNNFDLAQARPGLSERLPPGSRGPWKPRGPWVLIGSGPPSTSCSRRWRRTGQDGEWDEIWDV